MMVRLTDKRGNDVYVNPMYVKAIVPKGDSACEVFVTYGSALSQKTSIKVSAPAEEVAAVMSQSMVAGAEMYAAVLEQDEEARRAAAAAAAAAG